MGFNSGLKGLMYQVTVEVGADVFIANFMLSIMGYEGYVC
jgi:hypothetical protein